MQKTAAYDVISSGRTVLPNAHDGVDKGFDLDLPSANLTHPVVLTFVIHLEDPDDLEFKVWLNEKRNDPVFGGRGKHFNSDVMRTIQVVVPAKQVEDLKPSGNQLRFAKVDGSGALRFSDVVVWYHVKQ
jgi:hypothetical protein